MWLQFVGALRPIKQSLDVYALQSVFGVGPFSIFDAARTFFGTPFNISETLAAPAFTLADVTALLQQFAAARKDGIALDVWQATAGHAGLVCACGRAMDEVKELLEDGTIEAASWRSYRALELVDRVLAWPTMRGMRDKLVALPAAAMQLLKLFLAVGDQDFVIRYPQDVHAARLVADGWLVSVGKLGEDRFRVASPLAYSIAAISLASLHGTIADPLPVSSAGQLLMPQLLAVCLRR